MTDERKNCPMRHENGNCMSVGGFCLAVNDGICEGLRNAYRAGSLVKQSNESNWHTGTPTEEGWYLIVLPFSVDDLGRRFYRYEVDYFNKAGKWRLYTNEVKAWMPIEPYKETD